MLQGRGHKGRRGVAACRFSLNRSDGQVAAGDRLDGQFGGGAVLKIEFLKLFARQRGQARLELLAARRFQHRLDGPVFAGAERLNLHLALNDQAQAHRLHATRRFRAGQFAPQDGGQFEAHQIVQRAACQIGVHQILIHLTRVFHGLGHGGFGDRVEHHALDLGVLFNGAPFAQRLFEVPTDRFTFAIGVGREDQAVVVFQGIGDGFDVLFAVAADLPCHGKLMLGVDRSILGWQVADVAV